MTFLGGQGETAAEFLFAATVELFCFKPFAEVLRPPALSQFIEDFFGPLPAFLACWAGLDGGVEVGAGRAFPVAACAEFGEEVAEFCCAFVVC